MFEVVAGRYVLIDSIGSGGSGEVWRAFDRKRGEYCAAKVIRRPEAATLVRAVFEQGVRLDHPHVVTPYAWAADDEQVLLAMPLIRGGSLAVLLRDLGVLPARYGAEVLRQLLVALEHVHAAGLVHRDVKPANVLLESTGTGAPHARLADFGLVLTPDRPRITGMFMVVGTRDYLAPESLEHGDQGVAQDLYAAGLVGAEMVGAYAGPLTGLIAALTAPEPEQRPESATAALELLAEVLDGWPLRTPAAMPESDEPVEVFEQIGELPPGWGPSGPIAEAETESVEWLWSPEPVEGVGEYGSAGDIEVPTQKLGAVSGPGTLGQVPGPHGSGSAEDMEVPTRKLGSVPGPGGAPVRWPAQGSQSSGKPGEASGERQAGGSQGSSAPGGWAGQTVPFGGGSGAGPAERQDQGPQSGGAPGGWAAQTVPFGGSSGSTPGGRRDQGPQSGGDMPGSWAEQTVPFAGRPGGPPGGRQPEGPQSGGASGDWQSRTVPLDGRFGSGPRDPQAQGPQSAGAPGGWDAQTVPFGGDSGDWQSRTVPLGGAPHHAAGHRQAWNANPIEPDIDRVRLIPVFGANPGAVSAAAGVPSASRGRWRWPAMVAAAAVVAILVGVIVVALL